MSDSFQLIAPPHTPFRADGSLDTEAVPTQAQFLKAAGVDGVFVGGSTGEGQSLGLAERIELTEAWAEQRQPTGLRTIIHVGHSNQTDARRLAEHAAECGVDAIAAHSVYYVRPASIEQLVDFCKPIAAAGSGLPFYYYHIPDLTGVRLPMAPFVEAAANAIPDFAGVKFTDRDLGDFQLTLAAAGDEFEVLFGWDEALLAAIALGAKGAIGSTYNFLTPHYRQLVETAAAGRPDDARALQFEAIRVIETLKEFGYLAASKALMHALGCPCGTVRPPLEPLSPEQANALTESLTELECLGLTIRASEPRSDER